MKNNQKNHWQNQKDNQNPIDISQNTEILKELSNNNT